MGADPGDLNSPGLWGRKNGVVCSDLRCLERASIVLRARLHLVVVGRLPVCSRADLGHPDSTALMARTCLSAARAAASGEWWQSRGQL